MLKANWMALSMVGMLLPLAGFAEDTKSSSTDSEALPALTDSVETLLTETKYASRWQLLHPVDAEAYSDDWPRRIAEFDFHDNSAIARVRKVRNLSLLTLAEFGKTRLFLGVNEEGLVGLHFNGLPHYGDEHYMEVARMPYLEKNELDDQVGQLGPQSN